ncbi:RpoN/RPB10 RNA polymerase subunit family protein [Nitrosopumilus sp.]|nr:RpoN/RPB10 RNA polymerase subunit family protein [Nitrosopumilus sp.]
MIIPVKCFTCGKILADKYEYYCKEVIKQKKENGVNPEDIMYLTNTLLQSEDVNNFKTVEGKLLDKLGLTKMCCRRTMLTHVDII